MENCTIASRAKINIIPYRLTYMLRQIHTAISYSTTHFFGFSPTVYVLITQLMRHSGQKRKKSHLMQSRKVVGRREVSTTSREEREEEGISIFPPREQFDSQFRQNEMLAAGWAAIISRGYGSTVLLLLCFSPFYFYGLDKSL